MMNGQLKKVINRVAAELADLGLTSEVLKDLLEEHADETVAVGDGRIVEVGEDGISAPRVDGSAAPHSMVKGKGKAVRGKPRASYEMAGMSLP